MNDRWIAFFFILLLLIGAAIFWPALTGPFLLDDNLHLPKLAGNDGTIDTLREVYQLMFSGSSATGRPISFLSLLINDNSWPSTPWSFKYTNLLFHLLNAVLVFVVCRQLVGLCNCDTQNTKNANLVGLLAMAVWLFHPIHLSPTMMVIQRMTLLMGTFSLLGLIAYLNGRKLGETSPLKAYLIMSGGIAGFGILGVLSKETAIMMVCYIIAIEITIIPKAGLKPLPYFKIWRAIFLYLPIVAILSYFIYDFSHMQQLYIKREFNMVERLMTEPRVLMDYLRVIFFPSLSATGPYHDDYVISKSLLNPLSTLMSILFIIATITLAIKFRRRYALASLAVLWFFLAHILESTILPLELYFEHRNYLSMLGIVFVAAYWVVHNTGKIKNYIHAAAILFLCLEMGITYASSQVWGNSALIANVWAYDNPASLRAQLDAIRFWLEKNDFERVKNHINIATMHNPKDAGIRLYGYIVDNCTKIPDLNIGSSLEELQGIVPTANFDHASLDGIKFLTEKIKSGRCRVSYDQLLSIIDAYLSNPKFFNVNTSRGFLYQAKSQIYISMGDLDKTIEALDLTYEAVPKYGFALNQAYLLYTADLYEEALQYIEKAKNTKPDNPYVGLWKNGHIAEIENVIRKSMADENSTAGSISEKSN
jgi:tetratricopeptide (TPR) repeat protein